MVTSLLIFLIIIEHLITKYSAFTIMPSDSIAYDKSGFLIRDPSCHIPDYRMTYRKVSSAPLSACGQRKVHVRKVSENRIKFHMVTRKEQCQYSFIFGTHRPLKYELSYGFWFNFRNGTEVDLKSDFIRVRCKNSIWRKSAYEDIYSSIMKRRLPQSRSQWSVLILGMDTMSRARANNALPRTVAAMRDMAFLDFRAYNKVDMYTTENMIGALSSRTPRQVQSVCNRDAEACSDLWIWNEFEKAGYVTARGEDGLASPIETSQTSTHHYLKPLMHLGERRVGDLLRDKVCIKTQSATVHLLDYALDFVKTYHNTNRFFGFFYSYKYSHDTSEFDGTNVTLLDEPIADFLKHLHSLGVMEDTFVILMGDHGLRYGPQMLQPGSYYDARLPMLYIRPPNKFKQRSELYSNLQNNQGRLVTHFDLYLTLRDIANNGEAQRIPYTHNNCKECRSLLREIPANRTCADAGVKPEWCTCHEMIAVTDQKTVQRVVDAMSRLKVIEDQTKHVRTKPCTHCAKMSLKKILRLHTFSLEMSEVSYYELSLLLAPGEVVLEVTLRRDGPTNFTLVNTMRMTRYASRPPCLAQGTYWHLCTCVRDKACK